MRSQHSLSAGRTRICILPCGGPSEIRCAPKRAVIGPTPLQLLLRSDCSTYSWRGAEPRGPRERDGPSNSLKLYGCCAGSMYTASSG